MNRYPAWKYALIVVVLLIAALYTLRVQSPGVPRHAHRRWALAVCRIGADGGLLHRRLALSEPWPVPASVFF